MPGEEELYNWLYKELGRLPRVELKGGVIRPIVQEELDESGMKAERRMMEKANTRLRKKKL